MKRIYLTGNKESIIDYFNYGSDSIKAIHRTFSDLTKTLTESQALEVKKNDIINSDLIVCCLTPKYHLNAEDIFSISFAAGLGKTLAIVGGKFITTEIATKYHLWPFVYGSHIFFEDIYEFIEYLNLDKR